MTAAYGDVPLLDPDTGRFPDDFAPPSVAAAVTDAQTARQGAEDALADAVELVGDVTVWDARVAAAEAAGEIERAEVDFRQCVGRISCRQNCLKRRPGAAYRVARRGCRLHIHRRRIFGHAHLRNTAE